MKRPALDYFGGKWSCANKIISLFPEHKTFVDVFCGAASCGGGRARIALADSDQKSGGEE